MASRFKLVSIIHNVFVVLVNQKSRSHLCRASMSIRQRMKHIMKERGGFFALYRGIGPGSVRSFLSNGASMVVMVQAQRKVSEWGLRDR